MIEFLLSSIFKQINKHCGDKFGYIDINNIYLIQNKSNKMYFTFITVKGENAKGYC